MDYHSQSEGPVAQQLRTLIALDQMDRASFAIKTERETLLKNSKDAKAEVASFHVGLKALDDEETARAAKHKELEQELAALEQKAKKLNKGDVSSIKEYSAAQKELEAHKKRRAELDAQLLALMELKDSLARQKKDYQAHIASRKAFLQSQFDLWKQRYNELGQTLEARKQDRDLLISQLDMDNRSAYLRVMERYGDRAMVTVIEDRCSRCHLLVPPQQVVDILREKELHRCQYCDRFLLPNELYKE